VTIDYYDSGTATLTLQYDAASNTYKSGGTVTLTNTNTQRVYTSKTGSTGAYAAPEIEPGRYIVRFELKGFSTYEVPGINLLVGKNLKVDAVVPESGEGYEPFHAVYRREPCLAAIRAALDAGQRRMISWFPLAQVHILSAEQVRAIDPMLRAFENINTPEELEQAESTARQAES
jgi:hypothetical protein